MTQIKVEKIVNGYVATYTLIGTVAPKGLAEASFFDPDAHKAFAAAFDAMMAAHV